MADCKSVKDETSEKGVHFFWVWQGEVIPTGKHVHPVCLGGVNEGPGVRRGEKRKIKKGGKGKELLTLLRRESAPSGSPGSSTVSTVASGKTNNRQKAEHLNTKRDRSYGVI